MRGCPSRRTLEPRPVAARVDLFAFDGDFDLVLVDELLSDPAERLGIVGEKFPEGLFRERDAKPKVSLARIRLFHQQAEAQPTGSAANHHDLHVTNPATRFSTLVIVWERGSIRVVVVAIPLTIPR